MPNPQSSPRLEPELPQGGIDGRLVRGGDMRELMRARDWTTTPVGAEASWPHSLRTVVELCLSSRYPITVFWGPQLVQFYNDAYRPVLGATKHPHALGQPGHITWPEIWDFIGPMFADVMQKGVSHAGDDTLFLLDRHGYVEETYFNFSYDPIRDDDGSVGGVFVACQETTERVLGERRLQTLREVAEVAYAAQTEREVCELIAAALHGNAADVPIAFLYLVDDSHRRARLVAATRVDRRHPAVPQELRLDGSGDESGTGPWDWVTDVMQSTSREPSVLPVGPALAGLAENAPIPSEAFALALPHPGEDIPAGILIVGRNPHRAMDDRYRSFLMLLASNVSSVIANARAHEAVRKRAEALAELDRAKTAFFSNVSHEFRTPLTLMLGPLDDLLRSPLPPDRARAELRVIHRNSLRLLKLVNTLLDFSRIEAGRVDAVYEPTDLGALTAELASSFRSAIERAGLRFLVDCPQLSAPVYVDREMWEKIVFNLLSNAFKFTFHGEIAVSVRSVDTSVELCVHDTGVGIPASDLPRIFERFHRAKASRARTHEGTGIGLALVQELVKMLGGHIRADSVEERGTIMTVTIPGGAAHVPADRIEARRTLTSTATGPTPYIEEALRWLPDGDGADTSFEDLPVPDFGSPDAAGGPRPYIVCADDNADMRDYLTRLLRPRYDVETVADGDAAMRAIRRRLPDLVVSDVMMPGLDGFQLLRTLRRDPATRALPIVLLSARAGEESQVEGLDAGADDYLVKPFSSREMLARVGARLEITRVRKAALRKEQAALAAIEAGEKERRRISRELHDGMGQELAALVLGLKSVRDAVADASPVADRLQRLQGMAEQVGRDMHRIAVELRPTALDDLGLHAGLSNYVEDWSKRYGIAADLQSVGSAADRLPAYIETTIYRIVQEALTNVSKHARAQTVSVILQRHDREVVTIVEDDGCGFDTTSTTRAADSTTRLGLLGMKERTALVGGSFHVESEPTGTTVFVRIPLPPADAPANV